MFERLLCIRRGNQGLCVGVRSGSALQKFISNLKRDNPVSYTPTPSRHPIRCITSLSLSHTHARTRTYTHTYTLSLSPISRIIRLHNTYLRYTSYNILYSFILLIISILLTDRDSFTARTRANDRPCRARCITFNFYHHPPLFYRVFLFFFFFFVFFYFFY